MLPSGVDIQNGRLGHENYGPDRPSPMESTECVTSSSNAPGVTIAGAQSSLDPNCVKLLSGSDCAPPGKMRKLNGERSDPKKYVSLGYILLVFYLLFSSSLC